MAQTFFQSFDRTKDDALDLRNAAQVAVTATGAASVNRDIGVGLFRGDAVFDVQAIDTVTGDEKYILQIFGSNDATPFGSVTVILASLHLGGSTALGGSVKRGVGRYILPFWNVTEDGNGDFVTWRHIKVAWQISGTTPSIDFTCFVAKQ